MKNPPRLSRSTRTKAIVPVVLCGGSGTRLWPLSREQHPKQFLSLLGEHSLFQDTVRRTTQVGHVLGPVVVGAAAQRFMLAEQLREIQIDDAVLLLEPEARNTAPAVAAAVHFVAEAFGPEALVFVMAADHAIADTPAFVAAAAAAAEAAEQGHIVTFGIKPTRPETGYGYVRVRDGAVPGAGGAYAVDGFVEKPSLERARQFVEQGDHYWNGGLFLFRAGRFLSELRRFEPETHLRAREALERAHREAGAISLDPEPWRACRNESIDYAVMEKTDRLALVPLDAGWDDVGSWSFLERLPASDESDNHAQGDVLLEDAHRNLVHSSGRLVALVGVDDHVVVETGDAVLVMAKNRSQDVKKIVQSLKQRRRVEAEQHRRVYRPWGHYETIAGGERFQVKRIVVKPGAQLSLQMHFHRAEHWVVVKGTARVSCGDKSFIVSEDQSTYIPLGNTHRLENPGKVPLELIEVQTGCYLGEDDIVRLSDSYGRVEPAAAPPHGA
ncbi:mannose-1-phosphate guanylyltransferase/mannose-6-phosphate isomerase [Solimonas flava]|uniref:mannose-1-phosphate guanylyltransferase/mannose-6-phosphate isomerase n=1 Tax=Solimonas flava TaxID=415849 RepID=UPI000685790B|nr:mannose-1-phosphate guanylyltransferase/mannose-6-phosphate isomerase [Solimonas flava]